MAFDDIQIPLRVNFGSSGGPAFSTEIIMIDDGYERRNQNWSQARRVFDARTGLRSAADAATLLAFFHARAGRARGFRLKDLTDFTSASDSVSNAVFSDQQIGIGDGATAVFQLAKNYTSGAVTHRRVITKPVVGSVAIGVNGTNLTSGWSVDATTGLVTFVTPPSVGQIITAGFQFDVPVRFDTDQLSINSENYALAKTQIPIVEIRV